MELIELDLIFFAHFLLEGFGVHMNVGSTDDEDEFTHIMIMVHHGLK